MHTHTCTCRHRDTYTHIHTRATFIHSLQRLLQLSQNLQKIKPTEFKLRQEKRKTRNDGQTSLIVTIFRHQTVNGRQEKGMLERGKLTKEISLLLEAEEKEAERLLGNLEPGRLYFPREGEGSPCPTPSTLSCFPLPSPQSPSPCPMSPSPTPGTKHW